MFKICPQHINLERPFFILSIIVLITDKLYYRAAMAFLFIISLFLIILGPRVVSHYTLSDVNLIFENNLFGFNLSLDTLYYFKYYLLLLSFDQLEIII